MDKINKIKQIKIHDKNKFGDMTPDEIIMVVIESLKENDIEILYENVTTLAFLEFPEVFSLLGYSTLPDGKRVHDCLLHLGKHGKRLIVGDRKKGFEFSDKGKVTLEEIHNKIKSSTGKIPIKKQPPKTKELQMIQWIKTTTAYNKFLEKRVDAITEYEIRRLLRGTNLSTPEYLRKSLDAYLAYAKVLEDTETMIFLKTIGKKWNHLFQKIKVRKSK